MSHLLSFRLGRVVGHRYGPRLAVLLVLLALAVVAGITLGAVRVPLPEVVRVVTGGHAAAPYDVIIREVRLPRTITAVLVGAGLGITGLFMQTLFRNPLADPHVLGILLRLSL